jgi:putative Mn2+ efflux pump MntP
MTFLELLGIALALSADAFCSAIGVGAGNRFPGQSFRLSFHLGLFQALMPALGWAIGAQWVDAVRAWDHWIAGGIVTVLALHMFWEGLRPPGGCRAFDPTRGWSLVSLAVATSIDALAMGIVFAVVGVSILNACLLIGLVCGAATFIGLRFGRTLKGRLGPWMQFAGAALLLVVAINLFQI